MRPSIAHVAFLTVSSIAGLAGTALAEDAPLPAPAPMLFPTMAPDALGGAVSLQLGIQGLEGGDDSIIRIDVGAQFIGRGNAGGYVRMALATIEDAEALSNIELGGLYRVRRPSSDIGLRVGLVVPTASDDLEGLVGVYSTMLARPSDFVTAIPETTTLRLSAAPTWRSGQLVVRADVGIDIPIDSDGDSEALYHLDVGAGYDGGAFGITGELQTIGSTESIAEDTLHVFAVTAQGRGKLTPYATLSLPFASEGESPGNYNVFAGVRFGL